MWNTINIFLKAVDDFVWGVPLMVLIMAGGIMLTVRLGLLQMRKLHLALKWMVKNEEGGDGEITSFGALCTALSATIGTVQEDREHFSGWCLQPSLAWQQRIQRDFWL